MKSNRWIRRIAIVSAAAALLCAAPAMAVHYACNGPVNGVTVNPSGVVSAAAAGGQSWGFFCQLGSSINNVSAEACKGILAVLMTAQASGKTVTLWFDDNLTCSTHASWAWLDTVYWGPSMNE
jgi:uncharacterized SAM-dependent methyltransferase